MHSLLQPMITMAAIVSSVVCSPVDPRAMIDPPITILGNRTSAGYFSNPAQSTYVVYQAKDDSLQLLTGKGPPMTFKRTIAPILAAGKAKTGTPLALIEDTVTSQMAVRTTPLSPCASIIIKIKLTISDTFNEIWKA